MPARFALTIGINYRDSPPGAGSAVQPRSGLNPLSYAEDDAEDLAALLESDGYEVVKLIGASATRVRIIQELTKLNRKASVADQEGLLLVHYSGHGAVDSQDGLAFLLPADGDPEDLLSTAIPLEDLANRLLGRAQSALVLLDCCHSGYAVGFKGSEAVSKDVEDFVSLAGQTFERTRRGRITIAACAGEQLARERGDLRHGIFTYFVLEHWRTSIDEVNDAGLYEYLALNMPSKGVPAPVRGGSPQQGLIELRSRRVLPQEPETPLPDTSLVPSPVSSTRRVPSRLSPRVRAELLQLLIKTVSTDNDLGDLAFYAGLPYEKLNGTTLRNNFRDLIAQAEDSGRTRQLREAIRQFSVYHQLAQQPEAVEDAAHDSSELAGDQDATGQLATTNDPNKHVRLGNAYFQRRRYAEALAEYNKAIELDPGCVAAYNGRGDVYNYQHQDDLAFAAYSSANQLDPNNAYAYSGLGDAYYGLRMYKRALAEFNRATELDPKLADPYNGRGIVYNDQRQHERALAEFNRAIELHPNESVIYSNRGNTYFALQRYEQALADFNRAIELDPDAEFAYRGRADVYIMLGEPEKAASDRARATELESRKI